jgi:quercetin dioxygenase-like cupin family protein
MLILILGFLAVNAQEMDKKKDVLQGKIPGLKVDNMLTSQLESVEGLEVVVSIVEVPPYTMLPKHWHPGEEFAYVLEGKAILWQKDKPDTILTEGQVIKVPLKQVHTAKTLENGAKILVFRVHEQGKPVRVNVD